MTTYADALTAAVFEVLKDGDPKSFDDDFRKAYSQAARKEGLVNGQYNSFFNPVKSRVKGRVERYKKRAAIPTTNQESVPGVLPPKQGKISTRPLLPTKQKPILHHNAKQDELF